MSGARAVASLGARAASLAPQEDIADASAARAHLPQRESVRVAALNTAGVRPLREEDPVAPRALTEAATLRDRAAPLLGRASGASGLAPGDTSRQDAPRAGAPNAGPPLPAAPSVHGESVDDMFQAALEAVALEHGHGPPARSARSVAGTRAATEEVPRDAHARAGGPRVAPLLLGPGVMRALVAPSTPPPGEAPARWSAQLPGAHPSAPSRSASQFAPGDAISDAPAHGVAVHSDVAWRAAASVAASDRAVARLVEDDGFFAPQARGGAAPAPASRTAAMELSRTAGRTSHAPSSWDEPGVQHSSQNTPGVALPRMEGGPTGSITLRAPLPVPWYRSGAAEAPPRVSTQESAGRFAVAWGGRGERYGGSLQTHGEDARYEAVGAHAAAGWRPSVAQAGRTPGGLAEERSAGAPSHQEVAARGAAHVLPPSRARIAQSGVEVQAATDARAAPALGVPSRAAPPPRSNGASAAARLLPASVELDTSRAAFASVQSTPPALPRDLDGDDLGDGDADQIRAHRAAYFARHNPAAFEF